jgi:hypothetical protein
MSDESTNVMFDAIMAEAKAGAEAETKPEVKAETKVEAETDTNEPVVENKEEAETETEETSKPDAEAEKAKLLNKLSRENRKIGKLTAEKYQLKQELEALKAKQVTIKEGEPQESDFEGKPYGDYLKAVAKWEAKQLFNENQLKQVEEKTKESNDDWRTERLEAARENGAAAIKAFPDFNKVTDSAFSTLDPKLHDVFLEADNGAFALYALVKEGMIEELNELSPTKAAMLIARYEEKGLALSKKPTTKAPTPMAPNKGNTIGNKSLENKTTAELLKWATSD